MTLNQIQIFRSLMALGIPDQEIKERIVSILQNEKQESYDKGFDQGLIDAFEHSTEA